jgi:hypothetical protein
MELSILHSRIVQKNAVEGMTKYHLSLSNHLLEEEFQTHCHETKATENLHDL